MPLDGTGFAVNRLNSIIDTIQNAQLSIFPDINLDPSTPDAQLNALFAEVIYELELTALALYNGLDPRTSDGIMLDRICALSGITRLNESPTNVIVKFTGTDGAVIPRNTIVSSSGQAQYTFRTVEEVRIDSTLSVDVNARCDTNGEVIIRAGDIDTINTPVASVDTVTNDADGSMGRSLETDNELRVRRELTLAQLSTAQIDSVITAISSVEGVIALHVYENKEDATDANGIAPHTIWPIVQGGADSDIGQAIMTTKSLGCGLKGAVSTDWYDIQGYKHLVNFDRPLNVPIFVEVRAVPIDIWSVAYVQDIRQRILDWVDSIREQNNGLSIGDDVFASDLYPPLISSDQYDIQSVLVGLTAGSLGFTAQIGLQEVSEFLSSNISVIEV